MTPWIDVEDVKVVRNEIYNSIIFKKTEFARNSKYSKNVSIKASETDKQVEINSINSLIFARISVINFCNALTSYPSEHNIDIPMNNVAILFECPLWIIQCRHSLSHSSGTRPNVSILKEAIAFALEWMDRFFLSKAMSASGVEENISSVGPKKSKVSKAKTRASTSKAEQMHSSGHSIVDTNSTLNFGPPTPTSARSQIHHETCLLLFTSCPNNRADIKKSLEKYMLLSPNEFIRSFSEILTFGVPLHEKIIVGDFTLPALLLRRSSRIFGLIFTTLPADQMLILLLNLLIDLMFFTESKCKFKAARHSDFECNQRALHSSRCWMMAIMEALTTGIDSDGVPKRSNIFEKAFDFFGDLAAVKSRHTFDWVRILNRFCHLEGHAKSVELAKQLYYLIDRDVITEEKFQQIVNLIKVKTSALKLRSTAQLNADIKTIDHLKKACLAKNVQPPVNPLIWDFPDWRQH
ncbi:hypothetical protein TYRP_013575 [Tyrophagus putrescentiae]|nr:hypothetical protein TYRP_013575 [Tyrophagus putrescentiae]